MTRQIRKFARDFAAIIGLAVIALAVSVYILDHQRLRFPVIEAAPYKLRAAFSTAQAVTPGQGQTIRVSGVRIGDIGKVELEEGRAIVTMDIDQEFKNLVRTDATALLRPKTGLKDMFVELDPGSKSAPIAKEGFTIPVRNTAPDINPDEVYSALDADTRDYLKLLVNGAGRGLEGRGGDLQEVFRRFEPTHRDLARVSRHVARRHQNLRRLISSLNRLNAELAVNDDQIAQLVSASAEVFRAFASEEANVSETVARLPGALRQTTATLRQVQEFAKVLGPTSENLRPAVRALDDANKAVTPFARATAPIVRDQIRPFTRAARPVVRDLRQPARDLAKATPDLTRVFTVFNHFLNLAAYNKDGREAPGKQGRDEGYLFWAAWLGHIGPAVFSTSDAHGPFRPVTLGAKCSTFKEIVDAEGGGQLTMFLAPLLMDPNLCGKSG